ncbi:YdbL family protein [Suttonella ornithocola]|uniref:Uncharacterized protein conserved in bacteria n=1 Tax=Suttonella ornithocola TaxID=279832 RepID=A0A380MMD0_9GAMM|nr:YdbL family protein [Suttonella ornithocola]SUO93770.1 Uncharacterized protein conserved in bacteria [Suttonella ornithocola]
MIAMKRSAWLIFLLTLAACVTVNIYFPAAAAEKAADQIIEDVWHQQSKVTPQPAPSPSQAQTLKVSYFKILPREWLVALLSTISQSAYAQSPDFNASSPEVSAIKAKMASRFNKLKPYYDNGAIGLTADGYVALRDAGTVSMADRGMVQKLVNAENADRKALYAAIAKANNQPNWAEQIRQIFAKRWIEQAQRGWWVQAGGRWQQK